MENLRKHYRFICCPESERTIAIGEYKGKSYRAIVKCHEDAYDEATGIYFASLKLDMKILKKRMDMAYDRLKNLKAEGDSLAKRYSMIADKYNDTERYIRDLKDEYSAIQDEYIENRNKPTV